MKQCILSTLCALFLFAACKNNETTKAATPITTQKGLPADSTAIGDALRGFYTWYDKNAERIGNINYINDKGKHLILDEKQLQIYLTELKSSGFVSDELLADETKFYQACAKEWQTEAKGDVPTGLEADRLLCAQDYVAPYNTGTVTSVINGNRAKATLTLSGEGGKSDFKYEMVKEGDRWLLAKLDCDMGVKY